MIHRIPLSYPAVLLGVAILGLALSGLSMLPPPDSALAGPEAEVQTNGCTGAVTTTAALDVLEKCEPSSVAVNVLPSCPVCPGGMKVVFIQREEATNAKWQNREAESALEELEKLFPPGQLRVAVVHYSPRGARTLVRMTDNTRSARSALRRPRNVENCDDCNHRADDAARLALKELEPARGEVETMPVCKMVMFFAQDSPGPG